MAAVELAFQNAFPPGAAGAGGAGQAENDCIIGHAAEGPGLNGGTGDLGGGQTAELFAEADNFLVEQRTNGFRGAVPFHKAGAARDNDCMNFRIGNPQGHQRTDQVDVVRQDAAGQKPVAGFDNLVFQVLAGGVFGGAAGV